MDGGFVHVLERSLDSALLALLDQSRDCIAVIDLDGTLSFVSTNGLAAMGIDSFEAVMDQPWHALWSDDSQTKAIDAVAQAAEGEPVIIKAMRDGSQWEVAVSPVRDRTGRVTHMISTARPVSEDQARIDTLERDAEMQATVARETQHRLKNLITVIGSIAKLIARRSSSLAEFERSFQRQLFHLDRAQALLTNGAGNGGTLGQIVSVVLEGEGSDPRLTVGPLPAGRIGDRAVQLLALVLGELRTNAFKHGALSVDEGRITLDVQAESEDLRVVWTEDMGRDAPAPALTGGSGLDLIGRMIASTGTAPDIGWTGRGLRVAFTAPRF